MIICKVCGTENEQGASFCGSCGSFLEWNGEAVTPDTPAPVPSDTMPVPPIGAAPVAGTTLTAAGEAGTGGQGSPSAEPSRPVEPGQVVCPACGTANEPTRVYCRRCATELAPASAATAPVLAAPPKARSGPPVAILGGVAAVLLLGAVGAFILLPKGTPEPSTAVTASAPSSAVPSVPSGTTPPPVTDAPPTPAPPTASPPPTIDTLTGLIVFASAKGDNADLWVWDPADDSLRQLVKGAANQTEPAWSPDGEVIVYRSPDGLRMVLADGDPFDPPDFTHHAQDRNPTWSPDGKRIVFSTDRDPFTNLNIAFRAADDNKADLVVLVNSKGDDWDPAFSPDGSQIAFGSTRQGPRRIFQMTADGKDETLLDLGPGEYDDPAFSPDGEWLAFTRRDSPDGQKDLWVVRLDGSGMRQLTDTKVNENDMAWSPDGRVIAVVRDDGDDRIVLLDVSTGDEIGAIGVDGRRNLHPDWWRPSP